MIRNNYTNNKFLSKEKKLIILYLSDSKASETNIPFRLVQIINSEDSDFKIIFKQLNINNMFLILFKIFKSRICNEIILVHSHHLKSLIINIIYKLISNIFGIKLITYHSFLCELKRFSNIKLIIFKISKIFIDEYICVSKELNYSWGNFLNRNIHFIKVGISKNDKDIIQSKSINKNNLFLNLRSKDKCFTITQVGRLEEVKRPLFIFDILNKIILKKNQKIKLYFAGNGNMKQSLIQKINEFNSSYRIQLNIDIEYLGFINRLQLLDLISKTNLYINTSYSEGCLVTAMEFLSNPFCKLILPDVKSIKDIYNCRRSSFYATNDKNSLLNHIQDNLQNFYDYEVDQFSFTYPNDFEDFILENSTKFLINLYLSSALKVKKEFSKKNS